MDNPATHCPQLPVAEVIFGDAPYVNTSLTALSVMGRHAFKSVRLLDRLRERRRHSRYCLRTAKTYVYWVWVRFFMSAATMSLEKRTVKLPLSTGDGTRRRSDAVCGQLVYCRQHRPNPTSASGRNLPLGAPVQAALPSAQQPSVDADTFEQARHAVPAVLVRIRAR